MQMFTKNMIAVIVVVVLGAAAWYVLTMPDRRTAGQHVSDAVDQLPNGVDKAGRELEPRTPGQKLGDAIKDNTGSQ